MSRLWQWLRRPSTTISVLGLFVAGIVAGVVGWLSFDGVVHATGTNEFCGTACHSHAAYILPDHQKSVHFTNASGVKATCSDCHIPKEFFPKMWVKAKAGTHDAYAEFVQGKISTAEKYEKELPRLYEQVRADMKANDSKACRNCHDFSSPEVIRVQKAAAAAIHPKIKEMGMTCIDCHMGVAHSVPGQPKLGAALKEAAPAAGTAPVASAEALADKLGCLACHGVNEAKMGPALTAVAGKLRAKADAATIAGKLGKGEGHPAVQASAADLTKVADWVLSLAAAKPAAPAKSSEAPRPADAAIADGQALADKAGCLGCHGVAEKKMGPALRDEAAEWKGKAGELAAKLRSGQGHPAVAVAEDDMRKIVGWMLSL